MIMNWTWTHNYTVSLSKHHTIAYDFIGTLEYDIW